MTGLMETKDQIQQSRQSELHQIRERQHESQEQVKIKNESVRQSMQMKQEQWV